MIFSEIRLLTLLSILINSSLRLIPLPQTEHDPETGILDEGGDRAVGGDLAVVG
jgi:hypothetical protein